MKIFFLFLFLLWGSTNLVFSQTETSKVTVTGKVTDDTQTPLPGVSVTIKDQPGLGIPTDGNGMYRISLQKYQTLVFTFVGYDKKEVLVKDGLVINLVLEKSSTKALDEVVITALGPQKKVSVTGAVTSVDLSTLRTSTSSITNALAGNVAGVLSMQSSGQPGNNNSEFWIRGISTFGANRSALVLVDGFERNLNEVNIEDIESFSILKDASTTAIYGSRGANGVVLITTKRGKDGKVNINAKVEGTYNMRTFTPKFVDGPTYAQLMNEARNTRNEPAFYTAEQIELFKLGLDPDLYPNIDWMGTILKDGAYTKRGSLTFSGGGATSRYFVSGSFIDEGGMYTTDESLKGYNTNANHKRWNYRSNVDINLTKSTLVKIGLSGSLSKQNLPGASAEDIWKAVMRQNPIATPVRYSDGRIASKGEINPLMMTTQMGYAETWNNIIQTNVTLEQNLDFLTKGFRFVGRFGFDTQSKNVNTRSKSPEAWTAERLRDSDGNLVLRRTFAEKLLTHTGISTGERMETLQAELHYNKDIQQHTLGAVMQYSQENEVNTAGTDNDMIQGIQRRNQRIAGRFTYGYKSRYFVDLNFGYNGSENFARGHQFDLFPAVSAAWNIDEEPFIKNKLKWVDMLKLRYSFGKVGNDYMETRFPYLPTFVTKPETGYNWGDIESNNKYDGLTYETVASNNVTWEVATKHNLGLEWSLWNDKFSAVMDYFHEQRDGIFMERKFLPATVGIPAIVDKPATVDKPAKVDEKKARNPRANLGSVRSQGFDGQLKFLQKIGAVNLTLRSTLTYSKNRILEADEQYSNYPYTQLAGTRVDQNRGLVAQGLFKDYNDIRQSPLVQSVDIVMPGDVKYKDINGDGIIDDNDVVPIGSTPYPNLVYGFGLAAQWRSFDFNVHFQGAGKSSFFINGFTVYPFSEGENGNILADVVESNRWILGENEDVNAVYPRLGYASSPDNFKNSSYWLRESSYLRLKTLEIGYSLPNTMVNKLHINNLRVFFLGTNLLTFSKFKLWDPEMNSSNGQKYPLAKSFTIGIITNL